MRSYSQSSNLTSRFRLLRHISPYYPSPLKREKAADEARTELDRCRQSVEDAVEMEEKDQPRESPMDDEEARAGEGVDSADQYKGRKTRDEEEEEEVKAPITPFLATLNSSGGSGYLAKESTGSRGSRHDSESQEPFVRDMLRFNAGGSGSDREGLGLFGGMEQDAGNLSGELASDEISCGSSQIGRGLRAAKVGIPYCY